MDYNIQTFKSEDQNVTSAPPIVHTGSSQLRLQMYLLSSRQATEHTCAIQNFTALNSLSNIFTTVRTPAAKTAHTI